MATVVNECVPRYRPGQRITAQTTAPVVGKRLLAVSGSFTSGPGLNTATDGSNIQVATAGAGLACFGISAYDAASGAKVPVIHDGVNPVTADGGITAGQQIEVGTAGKAKAKASGIAVGYAISTALDGADVYVRLY